MKAIELHDDQLFMDKIRDRFRKKIRVTRTCWLWRNNGGKRPAIYHPRLRRTVQATHMSWWLATGEWPEKHMCHRCDNPRCVNPAHLFDGDDRENARDAVTKLRSERRICWAKADDGWSWTAPLRAIEVTRRPGSVLLVIM